MIIDNTKKNQLTADNNKQETFIIASLNSSLLPLAHTTHLQKIK